MERQALDWDKVPDFNAIQERSARVKLGSRFCCVSGSCVFASVRLDTLDCAEG
jgi:hypothetical protein